MRTAVAWTLLVAGCVHIPAPAERIQQAETIAARADWHRFTIPAHRFDLTAFAPRQPGQSETLVIYIAGDGLAWIDRATPSSDPTPINSVALRLALREPGAAAFLARPCQFAQGRHGRGCSVKYWTSHRFAPEVIRSMNTAIDRLQRRFGASRLVLAGYSGGGAVAALIAARRNDVIRLVTVAGNLDTKAWTRLHRLPALNGSLNPADFWRDLRTIPQVHYVGERDSVVPPAIASNYAARFPLESRPVIRILTGFNHHCCWVHAWRGAGVPIHR